MWRCGEVKAAEIFTLSETPSRVHRRRWGTGPHPSRRLSGTVAGRHPRRMQAARGHPVGPSRGASALDRRLAGGDGWDGRGVGSRGGLLAPNPLVIRRSSDAGVLRGASGRKFFHGRLQLKRKLLQLFRHIFLDIIVEQLAQLATQEILSRGDIASMRSAHAAGLFLVLQGHWGGSTGVGSADTTGRHRAAHRKHVARLASPGAAGSAGKRATPAPTEAPV